MAGHAFWRRKCKEIAYRNGIRGASFMPLSFHQEGNPLSSFLLLHIYAKRWKWSVAFLCVAAGFGIREPGAACDSNARASALPTDKGYAIRLVAWP